MINICLRVGFVLHNIALAATGHHHSIKVPMFSGVQEILLIGLIILGILILPRMIKPQPPPPKITPGRTASRLSGSFRLAIVVSILWPVCWSLYFEPWQQKNWNVFVLVGMGPVFVGWCIKWILAGMTNKR